MTSDSEARWRLYRDLNRARADTAEAQSLVDELQDAHRALLEKVDNQTEALGYIDRLATGALEAPTVYEMSGTMRTIQLVAREQLWTPTMNTSEWGDTAA